MAQWLGKHRVLDLFGSESVRLEAGNWSIDGTAVTSSASEMNALDGITANVTELNSLDRSGKISWFTDFLGDTIPAEAASTAGGGTGNAVALSAGSGGRLSIKSASDDGAFTANASAFALGGLDWRADSGGLVLETRIQCDDVSEAYIFIGFSDQLPGSGLEQPIFLTAGNIDSDATDACGVLYDVDGTTKQWLHGGVKNGTDTTPAYSGAAPVEATYETIRVEVSSAGAVTGYVNGTAIGSAVANAITTTAAVAPMIVVANRSANAVTCLVDYFLAESVRA